MIRQVILVASYLAPKIGLDHSSSAVSEDTPEDTLPEDLPEIDDIPDDVFYSFNREP